MTTGIMQSDHMVLRSIIDEMLNDPSPLVRESGELAKIEFEGMLKEQEEARKLIDTFAHKGWVTAFGLYNNFVAAHPEAK